MTSNILQSKSRKSQSKVVTISGDNIRYQFYQDVQEQPEQDSVLGWEGR
jgi:hypothetical protein